MKRILLDLLKTVVMYLGVVVGGTTLFLILSPVAGYLAYGDRPGVGWNIEPFSLSWEEFLSNAGHMLGWALLLSIYAIVIAIVLFGLVRILERFKIPYLGVAIVGAVLSGIFSGYIVLGIGWYIAIGLPAVIIGLVLGMLFGAFLLPQKRRIAA